MNHPKVKISLSVSFAAVVMEQIQQEPLLSIGQIITVFPVISMEISLILLRKWKIFQKIR